MSHTSTKLPTLHNFMQLEASPLGPNNSGPPLALVRHSFNDSLLVTQAGLPVEPLPEPKDVSALDGQLLPSITHVTVPLNFILSGNHS